MDVLHNLSMSTLDQKTSIIAYYLEHYSFPPGEALTELSDSEKDYLCENFSIRFKASASGYICFYGPIPGRQGMGETALSAFCLMIKNLGFHIDAADPLCQQLEEHFQEIA